MIKLTIDRAAYVAFDDPMAITDSDDLPSSRLEAPLAAARETGRKSAACASMPSGY